MNPAVQIKAEKDVREEIVNDADTEAAEDEEWSRTAPCGITIKADPIDDGDGGSLTSADRLSTVLIEYLTNPNRTSLEALPPELRPRQPFEIPIADREPENVHLLRLPDTTVVLQLPDQFSFEEESEESGDENDGTRDEVVEQDVNDDGATEIALDEEFATQSDEDDDDVGENSSSFDEELARRHTTFRRRDDDSAEAAKRISSGKSEPEEGDSATDGNRSQRRTSSDESRNERRRRRKLKYCVVRPEIYRLSTSGSEGEECDDNNNKNNNVGVTKDCPSCHRRFVNHADLNRHLKKCDPRGVMSTPKSGPKVSMGKFRCFSCQIEFESALEFQRHLLMVHKRTLLEKNQKLSKPRLIVLNVPSEAEEEEEKHHHRRSRKRKRYYECPDCQHLSRSRKDLFCHYKFVHGRPKRHNCRCNTQYSEKDPFEILMSAACCNVTCKG